MACTPLKALSQPLSLLLTLSFPDSPWHSARDTAVKITGLFHGNIEEEEAGLVGKGSRKRAETHSPVSAVGRPTAAVDVELSEPGSCLLLTHTLGLFTWGGSCVCVCVCVCVYEGGH